MTRPGIRRSKTRPAPLLLHELHALRCDPKFRTADLVVVQPRTSLLDRITKAIRQAGSRLMRVGRRSPGAQ